MTMVRQLEWMPKFSGTKARSSLLVVFTVLLIIWLDSAQGILFTFSHTAMMLMFKDLFVPGILRIRRIVWTQFFNGFRVVSIVLCIFTVFIFSSTFCRGEVTDTIHVKYRNILLWESYQWPLKNLMFWIFMVSIRRSPPCTHISDTQRRDCHWVGNNLPDPGGFRWLWDTRDTPWGSGTSSASLGRSILLCYLTC